MNKKGQEIFSDHNPPCFPAGGWSPAVRGSRHRQSTDEKEVTSSSDGKRNTAKTGKKKIRRFRSKSASDIGNTTKNLVNEARDRRVRATRVRETSQSERQEKIEARNRKRRPKKRAENAPDLLNVKLKELLDLVKTEDSSDSILDVSSGETIDFSERSAKNKQRPQSANLHLKPPKPRMKKRPESVRCGMNNFSPQNQSQRHRASSYDSQEEVFIDATRQTGRALNTDCSGDKREAFVAYVVSRETDNHRADALAWDVDISDCVSRASYRKKRPSSGETKRAVAVMCSFM